MRACFGKRRRKFTVQALKDEAVARSLNAPYHPCIEVFFDAHKECRGVALAHVQVRHTVDGLAVLHALQTYHPDGREIQSLRQLPRDLVWKPCPGSRVQEHYQRFPGGIGGTALAALLLNRPEDERLGVTRLACAKPRHHDVLRRPRLTRDPVTDDPIAANRITAKRELAFAAASLCSERSIRAT